MNIVKKFENTYFGLVSFNDKTESADGHISFNYTCAGNSFECDVAFIYMPIGEDDGDTIYCDVDIHAGGDGVGARDVIQCIANAWELHEEQNIAKGYRMTDG